MITTQQRPLVEIVKEPYAAGVEVGRISREIERLRGNTSKVYVKERDKLMLKCNALSRYAVHTYTQRQMREYLRGRFPD